MSMMCSVRLFRSSGASASRRVRRLLRGCGLRISIRRMFGRSWLEVEGCGYREFWAALVGSDCVNLEFADD